MDFIPYHYIKYAVKNLNILINLVMICVLMQVLQLPVQQLIFLSLKMEKYTDRFIKALAKIMLIHSWVFVEELSIRIQTLLSKYGVRD